MITIIDVSNGSESYKVIESKTFEELGYIIRHPISGQWTLFNINNEKIDQDTYRTDLIERAEDKLSYTEYFTIDDLTFNLPGEVVDYIGVVKFDTKEELMESTIEGFLDYLENT